MAIREGAWDCPACGRRANRGPEKYCAGCGFPRGPEVEFYLPEDAPEVTDAEALKRAGSGADWQCGFCGGDNRADADYCTGCGAPGEGAEHRQVVEHRDRAAAPAAATQRSTGKRPSAARRKELKRRYQRTGRRRSGRRLALGCLVLVLLGLLFVYLGGSREEGVATVTGFSWQRTIDIEAVETVVEEARRSEVPAGARLLDESAGTGATRTVTEYVQIGTERVKVGVRDLGNGYFEDVYEDRPVYQTVRREVPARGPPGRDMVRFERERWSVVRTSKTGDQGRSPQWPALRLAPSEREGERTAVYTVHFTASDGRTLAYRTSDQQAWLGFQAGRAYRVKIGRGGRVAKVIRPV